jgi:hypothetical protein
VHDVNAMLDDDMGVHVTDDVADDVINGDESEAELDDDAYGNNNNNSSKQPKDEQGSSGEDYLRSVLLRLIYKCAVIPLEFYRYYSTYHRFITLPMVKASVGHFFVRS